MYDFLKLEYSTNITRMNGVHYFSDAMRYIEHFEHEKDIYLP